MFLIILFLSGFLAGFFIYFMLCSGYLTVHLCGKALEYQDQVKESFKNKIIKLD